MTAKTTRYFEKALKQLIDIGFLHLSGNEIPNIRGLISGPKSKGSWWADPAAHEIFVITQLLEDHPDVMLTKLISHKVTFVHRALWPELFAVASARDEWQLRNLSAPARSLLTQIDHNGSLLTQKLEKSSGMKPGEAARELENRLLIHAQQFHSESGAHAKLLETWEAWASRISFKGTRLSVSRARLFLEKRVSEVNKEFSGHGSLPWQSEI
jgi:hypothetical protein